ncbi:MAG: hypothetical protein ACRD8O_08570 [Bryobacteraceae bacterium]
MRTTGHRKPEVTTLAALILSRAVSFADDGGRAVVRTSGSIEASGAVFRETSRQAAGCSSQSSPSAPPSGLRRKRCRRIGRLSPSGLKAPFVGGTGILILVPAGAAGKRVTIRRLDITPGLPMRVFTGADGDAS